MSSTIDYGIDLGTTNSSITLCRRGEIRIFQNSDLMNVTPSVVYISKAGRMLVGRKAYDTWVQDPLNTQAEFKRWMGYSDRLTFPASGKTMSAEELSAEVLKALRSDASKQAHEEINAAVITVPAAFGSLQCDATGRAAKLAGFEQAPLLQEPIAAAVAYGASPASPKNQRWMVFDLGGGTLDIAIVSTRNGRLAVLEHQGNNRLGGKDLDRVIAESLLLEPLKADFSLPDKQADARGYDRLLRHLLRYAETAKIGLSFAESVAVEIFDIGEDSQGKPIEANITLTRAQVESKVQPLIDQCLDLARRAMEGARLANADLDRILLVGGPTQMPILRAALESGIGAKLDYSLDPMTVVAQGAALYASTLEKTAPATGTAAAPEAPAPGTIPVQLSYERASGLILSPMVGTLPADSGVHEVKIDAEGGFWTSGWELVTNAGFLIEVVLNDRKPMTQYTIEARDARGKAIKLDPGAFSITFMLPMSAPPLPHTIAIEISTQNGVTTFDPVFKRHCPLPAEVRKAYRAERTLRPSEVETTLPIKFWEIDVSEDKQEKWWSGCVHIRAEQIKRPILEGSELELTIKIDASRKMTVEAFVPLLNQTFQDGVYIPDPPSARSQLQQQLDLVFERLHRIHRDIYDTDRSDLIEPAIRLQRRAEFIAEQAGEDQQRGSPDPDASLNATESLRKLRMQLTQLEEQLETGQGQNTLARELRNDARWTEEVIRDNGNEADKAEMAKLRAQVDKYIETDDARGMKHVRQQLSSLRVPILDRVPEFWRDVLNFLKQPGRRFLNQEEARTWLAKAEQARNDGDLPALRTAVNRAWALQPPDQVKMAKEQAAQSGLKSV